MFQNQPPPPQPPSPPPQQQQQHQPPQRPSDVARSILANIMESSSKSQEQQVQYIFQSNETLLDSYTLDVVRAIRKNDIQTLRTMLLNGHSFNSYNRNGETLLHLACRCSKTSIVEFLIDEASANINARDSLGRTILHDACWRALPNLNLMKSVFYRIPIHMILLQDTRGHCCFDYCRKEHWNQWITFLHENTNIMKERLLIDDCNTVVADTLLAPDDINPDTIDDDKNTE